METLITVIQYVLAAVGAFAIVLQAVAKITGMKPDSRPHRRLTKVQEWTQKIVNVLGILALNVGVKDDKDDSRGAGSDREVDNVDHSKSGQR